MKKVRIAAALLAAAGCARSGEPAALVLRDVSIVDPVTDSVGPPQTIVIRSGRIDSLGVAAPRGARVIEGRGRYLIPGLWDMHVHLTQSGEASLGVLVAHGVTGVRDQGGDLAVINAWRRRIAADSLVGPRIVAAGPRLDGPEARAAVDRWLVATEAQALAAVDSLSRLGVDFIKVYEGLPAAAYYAIARAAKAKGLPIAGHVPGGLGAVEASDSGQRSIEHVGFIPLGSCLAMFLPAGGGPNASVPPICRGEGLDSVVRRLKRNGTWLDPTLVSFRGFVIAADSAAASDSGLAYVNLRLRQLWREQLAGFPKLPLQTWRDLFDHTVALTGMLREARANILVGTDLGNPHVYPGSSVHEEMALLVRAGYTPAEALRAATEGPARFLGAADSLGAVAEGRVADLVLLDGNPLADIRNTRRIAAVVIRGRLLDRSALDSLLTAGRGQ